MLQVQEPVRSRPRAMLAPSVRMPREYRPASGAFDAKLRRQLGKILASLTTIDGVQGVTIIDRRGTTQASHGNAHLTSEVLYPFAATLAGAGHFAVEDLEANPDVRVTARSDRTRIHVAGINEEFLLVTLADNTKPWSPIRPKINDARRLLREAIAASGATR